MNPAELRPLGRHTDVRLTQLGLGGASIGELFAKVSEDEALACLRAAWDAGIRYFDTAPWYGRGLSELRTGAGLRDRPPKDYVLSTKVGRWLRAPNDPTRFSTAPWLGGVRFEVVFDYSYDGIMRSYEQSQLRLGLIRYDLAIIHDLDLGYHGPEQRLAAHFAQLATSGFRALSELKAAGLIRGIGAGINAPGLMTRFLDLFDMDFFLVAMPYTLLDQQVLDDEFPRCVERGVGVVIGAVFASGVLATGAVPGAHYSYAPAPPEVLERVRSIEAICGRHGIPLPTAALQFPLGHPAVASVIPGASRAAQVERNVAGFRQQIPTDLWAELKAEGLLRVDAPVPA